MSNILNLILTLKRLRRIHSRGPKELRSMTNSCLQTFYQSYLLPNQFEEAVYN